MTNEDVIAEIKRNLKADKLLIGQQSCMRELKKGTLHKILLASNCPGDAAQDVEHYVELAKDTECVKLDIDSEELGILCKRQHTIGMLGVRK